MFWACVVGHVLWGMCCGACVVGHVLLRRVQEIFWYCTGNISCIIFDFAFLIVLLKVIKFYFHSLLK